MSTAAWRSRVEGTLFGNRDFVTLWVGQAISAMGDQVRQLALAWLLYDVSRSSTYMGLMYAVDMLPAALFGLIAGVVIDRMNRQGVMRACVLLQAFVVGMIPVFQSLGILRIWYLYVATFVLASANLFYATGQTSIVPLMVPRDRLVSANAQFQMSGTVASIIGPAAAGMFITLVGPVRSLFGDAASFLVLVGAISLIRVQEPPARGLTAERMFQDLKEGLQYLLRIKVIRDVVNITWVLNLGLSGCVALLVFHARDTLALSARELSLIYAAGGIAAFLSGLVVGRLSRKYGKGKIIILGLAATCLGIWALVFGNTWWVLGLGYGTILASVIMFNANVLSICQEGTPNEMLGRVLSALRVLSKLTTPLGASLAGVAAGIWGTRPVFAVSAVLLMAGTLWILTSEIRSA